MKYDPPNLFAAACQCCGAVGPIATTRGAALVMWDERRAPGETAIFCKLANRLSGNFEHVDGICPRDGNPCASAGDGRKCCAESSPFA